MTEPLRTFLARRIATPWWNLRFNLGMWVGGFTYAQRQYGPPEAVAAVTEEHT